MESKKDVFSFSTRAVESNQPVAMVSQLMRDAAQMSSMDDVFLWLSQTLVQRLGVGIVQIWAMQRYSTGQTRTELRSFASQQPSLAQSLSTTPQIAAIAEVMFREKRGSEPLLITNVFAPYQANVFAQQNIHYWAGYFLPTSVMLQPRQNEADLSLVPTPLSLAVSLFMEEEPTPRLLRSIKFIFEQAIRIAISRGLLSSTVYATQQEHMEESVKAGYRLLLKLIPHHTQEMQVEQGINPFASATVILDKRSRKFYFASDGKKNVAEVVQQEHLEQKDLPEILQLLLEQKYIEFCEPGGRSIESSSILKSL